MELNIIELTKNYFDDAFIGRIAESIAENPSRTKGAMENIIPSLLAGIMDKASTTSGLQSLGLLLEKFDSDALLGKLAGLEPGPSRFQILTSMGAEILPGLLGEKTKKISQTIAAQHGISNFTALSLLSLVAPILISVIGKYFKTSGMSISGLAALLMGQKGLVTAALPAGLLSALNFTELGDFKGAATSAASSAQATYPSQSPKKSSAGWLPWALGALGLLAVVAGVKMCKDDTPDFNESVSVSIDSAAGNAGQVVDTLESKVSTGLEALGDFFKRKLPTGTELNIPQFGIENKLVSFIEDHKKPVDKTTWFNFDRINFQTGSAKLSHQSGEQTKNIAEILKAFPGVSVKIGGYTDNTGDAALNLKLSQSRAEAVKAAIVSQGIDQGRVQAEGYGKEHPVASNDTQEGRAQNRRIAVRVTAK